VAFSDGQVYLVKQFIHIEFSRPIFPVARPQASLPRGRRRTELAESTYAGTVKFAPDVPTTSEDTISLDALPKRRIDNVATPVD